MEGHEGVLGECCCFDLGFDGYRIIDVVVAGGAFRSGVWVVMEEVEGGRVVGKKFRFGDVSGGEYMDSQFVLEECEYVDGVGTEYVDFGVTGKVFTCGESGVQDGAYYLVSEHKVELVEFSHDAVAKLAKTTVLDVTLGMNLAQVKRIELHGNTILLFAQNGEISEAKLDGSSEKSQRTPTTPGKTPLESSETGLINYDANEIRKLLKSSMPVRFRIANEGEFSVLPSHPKSPYSLRNYCRVTSRKPTQTFTLQTQSTLEGGSIKIELLLSFSKDLHSERKASEVPELNASYSEVSNFNIQLSGKTSNFFMPLRLIHLKGSCLNPNITVAKMMIRNQESFRSNYTRPLFIFESLSESEMFLETVTLASEKVKNSGEP